MNIYILLLIGISLSMDSFSFALTIGTYYNNKKDFLLYSLIVGVFHFFMPFFMSVGWYGVHTATPTLTDYFNFTI